MLDVVNLTSLAHLTFAAVDAEEDLAEVVVAKGRYALVPDPDAAPDVSLVAILSDETTALFVKDAYFGALNASSVRTESDLAPFKPRCDLVVIGSAHSPTGKPVKAVDVAVAVDREGQTIHRHSLRVHGERYIARRDAVDRGAAAFVWLATAGSVEAPEWYITEARPFLECPIRYEFAYGGDLRVAAGDACAPRIAVADRLTDEERRNHPAGDDAPIAHRACRLNPVGRGFIEAWYAKATRAKRYPAPRIESTAAALTPAVVQARVRGLLGCGDDPALEPQGFGVVTKAWQPRLGLAGTYDAAWRETRWPHPPADFDMAYWNGAHPAMQCPHLKGGEMITLTNLLPPGSPGTRADGSRATVARFRLPAVELALRLELAGGRALYGLMPIDTVVVDLEAMALHVAWRISIPAGAPVGEACLVSLAEERARGAPAAPA